MSVSGARPNDANVDAIHERLVDVEGDSPHWMSFVDRADGVRDKVRALAGDGVISAGDVEAFVKEAKDFGEITSQERAVLTGVLDTRHADFQPDARAALARFLGVPDPGAAVNRTGGTGGRLDALVTVATSPPPEENEGTAENRPTFAQDLTLVRILDGQGSIARGSRGKAVVEVQRALLDAGFDLGNAGCDGDFGNGTRNAVVLLQREAGIPQTGAVDRRTLERIAELAGTDHRASTEPLIARSVGYRGQNAIADVAAVQTRLKALGYYGGRINGHYADSLGRAMRIFDATCADRNVARRGQAWRDATKLDPGEGTERWMRATNAPKWQRVPRSGTGWVNDDRDYHSHASSWLVDSLERVGRAYSTERAGNAAFTTDIHLNDASRTRGGDTHDHDTHEAGMDLDVRIGAGNLTHRARGYNREETWAKIKAFLDDAAVDQIHFNDPVLIRRANADPAYAGRLTRADGHDDHLHVDFQAPGRR